ncbi:MAG: guanylate kinase [Clostridia bacterium]
METSRTGLLVVMSGPSGVGKGTLIDELITRNSNVKLSISATTRSPRPGEVDGVDYYFVDRAKFEDMIEDGEFIEYTQFFNAHYYGTPKTMVEEELASGNDIILEIDVKGAMRIKETYPDAVLIFIVPPSRSELKTRLIKRGTEDIATIERRFTGASQEFPYMEKYDYIVVNEVIDMALRRIEAIVTAEKCKAFRCKTVIDSFKE